MQTVKAPISWWIPFVTGNRLFSEILVLVMLGFINYCVTGREAIELSVSIIFLSKGQIAQKHISTKYDLVCTTAHLVKIILLQLVLTLYMLADIS